MSDVESTLREAMAADVADVTMPPDLVEQVRVRHRGHRRRARLAATLAGAAVVAVAVPVLVSGSLPQEPPAGGGPDEVNGVELTYVPPGLHRGAGDGWDISDDFPLANRGPEWTAVTGRWYPDEPGPAAWPVRPDAAYAERGLRLTVFRGAAELTLEDVVAATWRWWDTGDNGVELGLTPPAPDADGRVRVTADHLGRMAVDPTAAGDWWRDIYWSPEPGVVLRAGTSADLAGELDAVVDGVGEIGSADPPPGPAGGVCGLDSRKLGLVWDLRTLAPGEILPGVRVSYVPDGLALEFPSGWSESGIFDVGHGSWYHGYHGVDTDTDAADDPRRQVSIMVICGEAARNLETVHRYYPTYPRTIVPEWGSPRPYHAVHDRPATVVDHLDPDGVPARVGRTIRWLEHPGVVIEVYAGEQLLAELDKIVANIDVSRTGW